MRINVALRDKKLASRREADALITEGKVFVNGKRAVIGMDVTETDTIEIRGKKKENRYFVYNKPVGVVTVVPQKGEKDISMTAKFPIKVFPIGRLDKESSGLIIMTNDGQITEEFLSPEREHEKEYKVSVDKSVGVTFKKKMEAGVSVPKTAQGKEGFDTKPCKVNLTGDTTFNITLTEGKNRQIRRMCETLGYTVTKLERVRIGKFAIGKLKPNEWKEVKM